MNQLDMKNVYPFNQQFIYESFIERINLDEEKRQDIKNDNGFIVDTHRGLKKDLKSENGIFSPKFGQTLNDLNPFQDKYKCKCGHLTGRVYVGITCTKCNNTVKFIDDDFGYFAYLELKDPYKIIHPNLYKSLEAFVGSKYFANILEYEEKKDQDGKLIEIEYPKDCKDEPYSGIGMIDFINRFDEIMKFYRKKAPNKSHYYDDIMEHKNLLFIQSIPVFTTQMRPYQVVDGKSFYYNDVNEMYVMMNKLVTTINHDELKIFRKKKNKNQLLLDVQTEYMKLYDEIDKILAKKKGIIRSLFGGRCTFTARDVITSRPDLEIDQVSLSYYSLVELLQQSIINILVSSYSMSYNEAYKIWYRASIKKDDQIFKIIENIIKSHPKGLPVIINRNPTICYGSTLQVYVVEVTDTYTMGVSLQILELVCGDFDGDVLNIRYIINDAFYKHANRVYNPANAMCISRNDGLMNNAINHSRDTIINLNTFINLGRGTYTQEMLDKIYSLKNSY